jgi:hypothetical protein
MMASAFNLITVEWINSYLADLHRRERVQELFRDAVKRGYHVPDIGRCGGLALRIEWLRKPNYLKDEALDRRLVQQGRAFLKTFAAVRSGSPEYPEWEKLANEIEALLGVFDEPQEILVIARWAQQAWAETNDGKYPRSTDPDAPLCKLVTAVLGEADIHVSPATVSAVLLGTRRQR